LGGEVQETSKKSVLKAINDQDVIQEVSLIEILRRKAIHTHTYTYKYNSKNKILKILFKNTL
jgi:hypothetical protein